MHVISPHKTGKQGESLLCRCVEDEPAPAAAVRARVCVLCVCGRMRMCGLVLTLHRETYVERPKPFHMPAAAAARFSCSLPS